MGNGKRGRPVGFKLSELSRRAISESKKGQRHKQETRDKISNSLIIYFKKKNPLSDELANMYCDDVDFPDVCLWMENNKDKLDEVNDVMTLKGLRNANRIELSVGADIEYFSHDITPELLVLFLEQCGLMNVDPEEYFDDMGYY
jgi:hypothetical protein